MKNKNLIYIFILVTILWVLECRQEYQVKNKIDIEKIKIKEVDENASEQVKISLKIFDNFFSELSKELFNAIKEKGISSAIPFCKIKSPELENNFSKENNKKIYRISEKYRNPDHKPTPDEQLVLEYWKQRKKENLEIKPVYYHIEDKVKVLKPIKIISDMCLQCHGDLEKMNPQLIETLKKQYPEDKAVGYQLNDLRGAFVAEFSSSK